MSDTKLELTAENLKVFSKMAALRETSRIDAIRGEVINKAFRTAVASLRPAFGGVQVDSPKADLTEFSEGELSGKIAATLTVNTLDGTKRIPITFKVKASVPSLVETTAEINATLEKTEGSIDIQVKQAMAVQNAKLAVKEAEYQAAKEIDQDLLIGMDIAASKNIRVFKAAKKETILDLGVDSNGWTANTFIQQIITMPKVNLPAMKIGQKLNLGGLIYKYVGDVPTLSGDKNNGVIAQFEYIAPFSKAASLNTEAAGKDFEKMTDDELEAWLAYLVEFDPEGLHDGKLEKRIIQNIEQAKNLVTHSSIKTLEQAMNMIPPAVIDAVGKSPRYSFDVYKKFAGSEGAPLDVFPESIQNSILNSEDIVGKLAKEFPRAITPSIASKIAETPELAAEVMEEWTSNSVKFNPEVGEILESSAKQTDWYGKAPEGQDEELAPEEQQAAQEAQEEEVPESDSPVINPDAPAKLTEEEKAPSVEETEGKTNLDDFSDEDRGVPTDAAPEINPAKTREELAAEKSGVGPKPEEKEPAKIFNNPELQEGN